MTTQPRDARFDELTACIVCKSEDTVTIGYRVRDRGARVGEALWLHCVPCGKPRQATPNAAYFAERLETATQDLLSGKVSDCHSATLRFTPADDLVCTACDRSAEWVEARHEEAK